MDEKKQANKGQNLRKITPGGRLGVKTCQRRTVYSVLTSLTGSEAQVRLIRAGLTISGRRVHKEGDGLKQEKMKAYRKQI